MKEIVLGVAYVPRGIYKQEKDNFLVCRLRRALRDCSGFQVNGNEDEMPGEADLDVEFMK